jgi:hypothetical protein
MQSLDINSASQEISSKINSTKTAIETFSAKKSLKRSAADSASKGLGEISSQLDKVKDLQKRFQREPPNSMDELLNFLGQTRGNGSETFKYLRRKILEAAATIEPKVSDILKKETLSALGCSQQQTYKGVTAQSIQLQPLPLRPQQEGIYIPLNSVDFFSNLKKEPESQFGKVYYEKPEPTSDPIFTAFGGDEPYPMNKQLYRLMESSNSGRSLSQILGKNYQGESGQNLFDIQYTKTNSFGVNGDYYRVMLIDREDSSGITLNKVFEFISDYYSTINLVDPVDLGAQLINIISGALNISANVGFGELDNQSKFSLLVQRILGLCFDNRREIDVSGVSKIAELDGVDDSFFELNEIDLRNIDINISNIQNGVMEFEDCNNVKLPVNSEVLVDQLIEFRGQTGQTTEQIVSTIEQIIDSISENPEWRTRIPASFNENVAINKNVIKQIPLAIAAGLLTPKVLLPIYTLASVVQSASTYTYNQAITSANTFISSANTVSSSGSNVVTSGSDFLKKWKTFSINIISKINAEFLSVLYELLKKDIVNLLSTIIVDISKSKVLKKYKLILTLLSLLIAIAQLISDYRRCKNLLDNILSIFNIITNSGLLGGALGKNEIPLPALLASKLLPGFSPERAFINVIEELQSVGIPTGILPDGSPNLMGLYSLATQEGREKEEMNRKYSAVGVPTIDGLIDTYVVGT